MTLLHLVKLTGLEQRMSEMLLAAQWVFFEEDCDAKAKIKFYEYAIKRSSEIAQEMIDPGKDNAI